MTVSLVGYTNAGKSTLMNALTGAGVYVADKLFATLDTRTRRWQLPNWGPVLLSDTVGFIRDLPHHLIASFKATLEEARQADLLLHVADASNPAVCDQIAAVSAVLKELGLESRDSLLVINKIDRLCSTLSLGALLNRFPNAVPISAKQGLNFEQLAYAVSDALSRTFCDLDIETGVDNGRLMAYLAAHGEVLSKQFHGERVIVHCRLPQKHVGRIQTHGAVIRTREERGPAVDSALPRPEARLQEEVA
jgi:GTP-binding protein HflX